MGDRQRLEKPGARGTGVVGLVLLGALGGWVGGCANGVPRAATDGAPGAGTPTPADLPPGAIQVGPDLYQVPIGADQGGCQMYRPYSPTLMVTPAISYRSRAGGFTIDKRVAVCDPAASGALGPGSHSR